MWMTKCAGGLLSATCMLLGSGRSQRAKDHIT